MRYLLDTNVCIHYLNQSNLLLKQKFAAVQDQDKVVCSIVRAELFYGAYKSQRRQANLASLNSFLTYLPSLAFDDASAEIYGQARAELAQRGSPIGHHDLQIAAIALANHLTVITHNVSEFSRVPNLLWEDWEV